MTRSSTSSNEGIIRFAICAFGICACYMYYGVVQESLFKQQKIGPSFVLLIQCVTNSIVARVWQSLDQWMAASSSKTTDADAYKKKNDDAKISDASNSTTLRLHHPLLAMISLCYVSAMVCSNESLHFVSYPTAVLAKSCKLIPTMAMGVLIEKKAYAWFEWMAALCITAGIVLFNFSRMSQKGNNSHDGDDEDSLIGLGLLSLSLIADGFLGSCQGLIKQKRTLTMPSWLLSGGKQGQEIPVRPPHAVETMLFVNLYAIIYLIPLTIVNHQMEEGLSLLRGTTDPENHTTLIKGMVVLNMTVAVGQIFIFLTITWYSSLVCTTITTTRKFFTILLSVMYFGHHFTLLQWISTGLVFCGLYLGIMGQRAKQNQHPQPQPTKKNGYMKATVSSPINDFSTTHFARLDSTDSSKMD